MDRLIDAQNPVCSKKKYAFERSLKSIEAIFIEYTVETGAVADAERDRWVGLD